MDKDVLILAIESSCDETAVAVVKTAVMCCQIQRPQIELHKLYGGVVPENCIKKNISKKSIRLSRRHWMRPM